MEVWQRGTRMSPGEVVARHASHFGWTSGQVCSMLPSVCPSTSLPPTSPRPLPSPSLDSPLITRKNIFVMRHPLLSLQLLRVMERFQSLEDKSQALGCLPGRIILHQVEFCSNYLQNSWTAG